MYSLRESTSWTIQSELDSKLRRTKHESVAGCSLTKDCMGFCRFMGTLGFCCWDPVMVNLLVCSRCGMYFAAKSIAGVFTKTAGCTHVHTFLHNLICCEPFICFIKLILLIQTYFDGLMSSLIGGGGGRQRERWISTWLWFTAWNSYRNILPLHYSETQHGTYIDR